MPPNTDSTIALADGRRLAYTEWGDPNGFPILYFHGTPGSRLWCPDEAATRSARVRLVMPDRPGFGRSDDQDGRTLADWPSDVVELADALGIERFAVVGVSAGGTYAAACGALIPSRLTAVGIVSCRALAQDNVAERPGSVEEWTAEERAQYELAQKDPSAAAELADAESASWVADVLDHPESLHESLSKAEGDRWFFADLDRVATFDAHIRETWRQGQHAIRWEMVDVFQPWGFRLADISIPTHVWHGAQDPGVKQEYIDFTASRIPNCRVVVWPDGGHLAFVKHWDEVLTALT